ncbi:MAG: ABC transporter ATP-binding protein [Chlamydiota bacterium]
MMPLLQVKDLRLSFYSLKQKICAVRGVSFSLEIGETVGIVGESGSGKSALARSLVGLNPVSSSEVEAGEIKYQGEELLTKSERDLRSIRGKEIAMVFQDPMAALNPTTRVGRQIAEGYKLHYPRASRAEVRERVLTLLRDVGIAEPALCYKQYPYELSGGMRQRAMIATAMIASPKILIADEPTTALDVTIQAQILELLCQVQQDKAMSILLITHDLSIAAQFCDRILVMYAGQIVESAPAQELFQQPKHPYTRALLNSIPKLQVADQKHLDNIPGSPPDLAQKIIGCSFCPRCAYSLPICSKAPPPPIQIACDHTANCFLAGDNQ